MIGLPDPEKSRAILIGVPDYAELEPLPTINNNIRRFKELLSETDLWGLPEYNFTIIVGDDDPRTIPRVIRDAARSTEDLLLIYYAGHGLLPPDSDKFCLALPSSSRDYTDSAVRYEDVRGAIACAKSATSKVVILDCCFAARASVGGMSPAPGFGELTRINEACMLTACDETTQALAPPGETYTAFTGELLNAIETGLDGAPALLDLETLYRHLCVELAAKSRPQPQFFSRGEGRNLSLVRNRRYAPSSDGTAARVDGFGHLPEGVMNLAHAQVRAADDFPYRLVGARRSSLSAVYVKQDVTESSLERQRSDTLAVPANDRTMPDNRSVQVMKLPPTQVVAVPRTLQDALRLHRHMVIVGGPGQGKSTLTLQLAGQLAHDLLQRSDPMSSDERAIIPVRITAASLVSRNGPLFRRIREAAAADLGLHLDNELPEQLIHAFPPPWTWLIVVDGLDEITDPEQRATLIQQLAARTRADEAGLRLLVTTRPLQDAELEPFRGTSVGQYQLEPFSRERLRDFSHRWFSDGEHETLQAAEFLRRIQQAGPSELVRVPLLATIAAIVYEQRPSATLPSNRYVLYQSYLAYLQAARSEATSEQWRRIRNRVRSIPGADTRPFDYLRGHLPQLVTHLAEAAVSGEIDLTQRALSWIEQRGGQSMVAVPDWAALVAALLDSTGLFVHTASGQRFIHHSFAEHLAAQAMAGRLPSDFDHAAPALAEALQKAMEGDQIAVTALVHHSHCHPTAEDLLGWLESGQENLRELAGKLLAEGINTRRYENHVALFMEFFLRQLNVQPGSGPASRDLWPTVSCLSDGTTLEVLQRLAADSTRPADQRIRAAKALPPLAIDCAASALHSVIAAADSSFFEHCEAAAALAELGSDHSDEAAIVFRRVINDPASRHSDRSRAAAHLADLGSGYREEATAVLREIANSAQISASDRASAADDLAGLGAGYAEEAAAVLREIVDSEQTEPGDRGSAAKWLGGLGAAYAGEAAAVLRQIIASEQAEPNDRASAARDLASLGATYVDEAAAVLRQIIASEQAEPNDRASAARDLASLSATYVDEAAAVLRQIIASEQAELNDRASAARWLAGVSYGYAEETAAALREMTREPIGDSFDRVWAVASLGELGPGYADEAAALLREIFNGLTSNAYVLAYAASSLGGLGPAYVEEAAAMLRKIIEGPPRSASYAAAMLGQLGPGYAKEAVAQLRKVIVAPISGAYDRVYAATLLGALGAGYAEEAVAVLREIVGSEQAGPSERATAARWLGGLGPSYVAEAAAALREIVGSEQLRPSDRASAADDLAALGPGYVEEAVAVLREIVGSEQAGPSDRASAARWLGGLGPSYVAEAAAALREIVGSEQAGPSERASAARWLGGLGPSYVAEAAAALREIVGSEQLRPSDRASAADDLAALGPGYVEEAVAALREIVGSEQAGPSDRASAARWLGGLGPSYSEEAIEVLREIISSPGFSPYVRADAADDLARLSPRYTEEVAVALRALNIELKNDFHWTLATRWLAVHGPGSTDEGAQILREMIFEWDNAAARSLAARWLAELGPAYTNEGAQQIRAIIASAATNSYARASAADDLARLGSGYTDEAAVVLREVMNSQQASSNDRARAAKWLARLGPSYVNEAAETLRKIVSSGAAIDSATAARWLGALGPSYIDEATTVLKGIISRPLNSPLARSFVSMCLSEVSPRNIREALQVIRSVMSSENSPSCRCFAALLLATVNSGFTEEAVRAIQSCVDQPWDNNVADRTLVAVLLSEASSGYVKEAEQILLDATSTPNISSAERYVITKIMTQPSSAT